MYESNVSLRPFLVTALPPAGSAPDCRCGVCEARRATRLTQALHNRYGQGLALVELDIDEG
jgi:hypothetical protein